MTSPLEEALHLHPLTATPDTPLLEVIRLSSQTATHCYLHPSETNDLNPHALEAEHTGCVLIVEDSQLVGILTERDIVRLIAEHRSLAGLTVAAVMSQPVIALQQEDQLTVFAALDLMRRQRIRHLPMVDRQGHVMGLLTPRRIRSLLQPSDLLRIRRVHEVMTSKVVHALPTDSVLHLTQMMTQQQVSCVVIVEATAENSEVLRPIGIITERDMVQFQRLELNFEQTPAQEVMSTPLSLVNSEDSLWTVHQMMQRHKVRRLVVADPQGHLQGIVTQSSLLPVDPAEMYEVMDFLQQRVSQLEAQNQELLLSRNQELEQEVQERTSKLQRREQILHQLSLGVAAKTGEDFFKSLAVHLAEALQVDYVHIGQLEDTDAQAGIRTLAAAGEGQLLPNFEYALAGTPGEDVVGQQTCMYRQGVQEVFPHDPMLRDFQIEGYLGISLRDSAGQTLGLVAVLSCQPIEDLEFMEDVLTVLAHRATTELERQAAELERQRFLAVSLDLHCIASFDGYFKTLNPSFVRILGYSTSELLAQPFLNFVHPEDRGATVRELEQLAMGTNTIAFENRYRCRDGSYRWLLWSATPYLQQQQIYASARDITERKQMEQTLALRASQQTAVSQLGQLALVTRDIDSLMNEIARVVARTLTVEYCKVLQLLPDGESLLLKAGVGWQPGLVGKTIIGTKQLSQAGYTLRSTRPVIVDNLQTETRFSGSPLLHNHNVISGMSVIIQGQDQTYGVIGAHTIHPHLFSEHDIDFLQSVANLLAQAMDRHQADQTLRQSEHEYRTLAENLPGIVYRVFPEDHNRMLFLNDQCKTLTGNDSVNLSIGEVCSIDPLIVSEDRPQVIATVKEAVARLEPFQVEYRIKDHQDQIRYFWEKGQPIPAQNGQPLHIDGVIFEVTERKLAQEQLLEQAALLDVATDAILVQGFDGRIQFWNEGATALYGWTREEVFSQDIKELLHAKEGEEEKIEQCMKQQGHWQGELEQKTKAGETITVLSRWTLVKDSQNNPKSALIVNTDITQSKKLEKQFLRAQRLESIGSLASGIAHDLNNILTPIYGVAQLLPMQLPNANEQIQHQFEMLQVCAQRGSKLVSQVLSFSRGIEGERAILPIRPLLTELRDFAHKTFPKTIEISMSIPEDLWFIKGDATQIHQVFMNLFVNARDAMPEGGALSVQAMNFTLNQTFAANHLDAQVGPYILVTVTDTGIGIPPEVQDRIFEPFFTTRQPEGGTGLGLSTVNTILKSHGGFITVYSEVSQGTQFKIYLPAIESESSVEEAELEFPLGQGELVLVVDDEAPIREVTQSILEKHNYQVLVAEDGLDAIAQYAQHQLDIAVVLMDMKMPGLSGEMTIKALQKVNSQLKVIVTSGLLVDQHLSASIGKSVKGFLQKPYSSAALLRILHNILDVESENLGGHPTQE